MKVISFFSGAGGMDLGFILAGHQIVWANDFDKDAVQTYNENIGKYLGHESILGDITKLLNKPFGKKLFIFRVIKNYSCEKSKVLYIRKC